MSETSAGAPVVKKPTVLLIVAWAWVLVPFAYGLNQLVVKVVKLFNS
jgi:hypothetical protein